MLANSTSLYSFGIATILIMSPDLTMSPELPVMSPIIKSPQKNVKLQPELEQKSDKNFTHLHLHTCYSLLDGAIRITDLMKQVKAMGMSSVAITDHGNLFGAVEFYRSAVEHGIKPIIGCEFYVAPGDRRNRQNLQHLADGNNYHLIILARNQTGYRNLIRLTSRSYTEGFYRKPRIDYDLLAQHAEGLICTTACIGGEVQRKIINGQMEEAVSLAGRLGEIFGKENFFLELQKHGIAEEEIAAKGNLEISRRLGLELCLTNDSHYLKKNDQTAQEMLLRINQKKTIADRLAFNFNNQFYVKSSEEMYALFPELPHACRNTMRIAEMIELEFQFGNPLLPRFDLPEGEQGTLDSYLHKLAWQGLERRYSHITPAIKERFEYEYNTICRMDFAGYFLVVQDFINFAKQREIPVGPGRGSAAGSIISYALGITEVDPLRYDLLFERFLNPDRREMPDIDVDFCAERRDEVINYVRAKYGSDRVGQIITFGTMAAKACLKDVARVMNIPFEEANSISAMFPDALNISLKEAVEKSQELQEYSRSGELQRKLFQVALVLEGNVRHTGVHAAGIVIAPKPLEDLVPMATIAPARGVSAQRVLVSQYDMNALSQVGLVKMDFLGLRNLTAIQRTLTDIKAASGEKIDLDSSKMDDKKTYRLLQSGNVSGVFQLESSPGMREFVIRMRPERFEELIALIALFRPGPLKSGMADSYINRKNGDEKIIYPHSDLEKILKDTYGVIIYQEQVMRIAQEMGGLSPAEADALRKAMGKKIQDKMAAMKIKFIEGAVANGYDSKMATHLYDQMAHFAEYGFNKSHSAAYACIVYQTAWLKTNYPTNYMCALLDLEKDKLEKLMPRIYACQKMNIKALGPDINRSQPGFQVEKEREIRYGMAAIKNVGLAMAQSIVSAREKLPEKKFHSFFEFMENIDLKLCNRRAVESLVQAGAFRSLGYTCKALQESVDIGFSHAVKHQQDKATGQSLLFGGQPDSGGELGRLGRGESIPIGKEVSEFSESELLRQEKEVLGFYLNSHPLKKYARRLKNIKAISIEKLSQVPAAQSVELAGVIADYNTRLTRSGKEMCRLLCEDLSGKIEGIIFPATYEKIKKKIVKDTPCMIQAKVEKREETNTLTLIINDISALNHDVLIEKQEKSLHLKLYSDKRLSGKTAKELKTILSSFRGSLQLYFHLIGENGSTERVIRAHKNFQVDYNRELQERLSRIEEVAGIYLSIGDQITKQYEATS